jgi:hypothetical protein
MKILLINVYHGGQILNTSTGVGYDICAACTFSTEEDDIQDETDINMDEIEDATDVKEIVKEWQMFVPFINRGMKHSCT